MSSEQTPNDSDYVRLLKQENEALRKRFAKQESRLAEVRKKKLIAVCTFIGAAPPFIGALVYAVHQDAKHIPGDLSLLGILFYGVPLAILGGMLGAIAGGAISYLIGESKTSQKVGQQEAKKTH